MSLWGNSLPLYSPRCSDVKNACPSRYAVSGRLLFIALDGSSLGKCLSSLSCLEHDDMQHWTWNGSPLYYFAGDTKPGDRNGDGRGGVWHVVKPTP
ncbi:MAG: hypothetical protein EKK47_06195 [Burkholderiales bacterium]|nr:MAG: hypothetical protein EKK47_06195 [Burkholderiales bacterium]